MNSDSTSASNRKAIGPRTLRGGIALLVIACLVGAVLLLVDFETERPDYYRPARAPLVEAATILSETYGEEKALMERLQKVHSRLEHSISLLRQAEHLDHQDKTQIEAIEVRLRALEDTDRTPASDPGELQRTYQDLTEELHALAAKLAQPGS